MAKRLISLAIFSLFLLIFLSTPSKSFALPDAFVSNFWTLHKDYCDLRKGNQMNLETWYSGRCGGSFQERLGFADMVLIDAWTGGYGPDDSTNKRNSFLPLGIFLANISTSLPASSTQYVSYVAQNLNKHSIVQSAFAQSPGYGFKSLGPVLDIWKLFRDIVYLLFVLAFVIYGFAIMFRSKISAQTVMSIQTAIPNLIITLVLITFSYAIAGLVIDFTFVIQEVVLGSFFGLLKNGTVSLDPKVFGQSVLGAVNSILEPLLNKRMNISVSGDTDSHFLGSVFIGRYGGIFMPLIYVLISITAGDTVSKIFNVLIPQINIPFLDNLSKEVYSNPIINIIIWLVLFIAILYTFFKIVWMLVQAFVMVIFHIIFAPFTLLKGIFPGNDAFGEWLRSIISYMAAFPGTIFCFLLSFIFLGPIRIDTFGTFRAVIGPLRIFTPTVDVVWELYGLNSTNSLSNLNVPAPIGVSTNGDAVMAIIGIGILLMTPKIVEMLQEALKAPAFKYGAAIGEALNYGFGPISAPINFAKDRAMDYAKTKTNEYVGGRVQEVQNTLGRRPEPVDPRVLARMNYGTGSANPDDSLNNTEPG